MKILVLSNLYPPDVIGGYELVCAQVVDALRERGHELYVLTSSPRHPVAAAAHVHRRLQFTNIYDALWAAKTACVTRTLAEVQANYINAHNVHGLLSALEEFGPDVVYLHNLVGLGGLGLLACLHHLRVPWVWQLGDAVPRHLCSKPCTAMQDFAMPWGEAAPVFVAEYNRQFRGHYLPCSRRLLDEIEACGLCIREQAEILPNWFHGPRPKPRTAYLQANRLRIVTAGAVSKHKGTDILIEAAAVLCRMGYDNFSIDIYGKAADPTFQTTIAQLGVGRHVALMGTRSHAELAQLFAEYDVFAFPTWQREPFGVAPLEAGACGCVPLLSRSCGIAEWFVHGVHCLKAERTSPAFAEVFAAILDGIIDLEPLGRRASAVIQRDFHLDAVLPKIERALQRMAGKPRQGAGTAAEAYQLALLAERTAQVLVQDSLCA